MRDTLTNFREFRKHTADDLSAALLTLAASLAGEQQADSRPLTVAQAAARMNVSKDSIYGLIESGTLRHQRVGRSIRIRPEDLQPRIFKLRELL